VSQEIIGWDRVFGEVKNAISSALGADEASIEEESVLTRDLDAESLDFLDISYHLEQAFGFRMARHFVLEHAEEMFGEGKAIDENGCLTAPAVKMLRLRFKGDPAFLKPGMDMDEVVHLVTVDSLVKSVLDILDSLPETCPTCGHASWKTDDGTHILCGSCGAAAAYKTGDDLVIDWLKRVQEKERLF
jgi:acyl carrier protein